MSITDPKTLKWLGSREKDRYGRWGAPLMDVRALHTAVIQALVKSLHMQEPVVWYDRAPASGMSWNDGQQLVKHDTWWAFSDNYLSWNWVKAPTAAGFISIDEVAESLDLTVPAIRDALLHIRGNKIFDNALVDIFGFRPEPKRRKPDWFWLNVKDEESTRSERVAKGKRRAAWKLRLSQQNNYTHMIESYGCPTDGKS